ncbi:hypothetical protein D3C87_1648830 [compost metagenome]
MWISAPGLVIDSTIAASPATFLAMSAITVNVVTALNFSCARAVPGTSAKAANAVAATRIARLV